MKAVLISIQPKWCEKIANGEKTIEVRKTAPKEVPFKVYIYCTKHGKQFFHNGIGEKECLFKNPDTGKIKFDYAFEVMCCKNDYSKDNFLSGKVIGEFVCDWITEINPHCDIDGCVNQYIHGYPAILGDDCLSFNEMNAYLGNKKGYDWHISDLVIYDKPKDLSEFRKPCPYGDLPCWICPSCDKDENDNLIQCFNTVSRPPQSWCYVEELQEEKK